MTIHRPRFITIAQMVNYNEQLTDIAVDQKKTDLGTV